MKDRINVAELLKDCPKGMELDCTMFEGVSFDHVSDLGVNKIKCYVNNGNEHFEIALDKYGRYVSNNSAKCIIFPKGKTSWEGFVPPCKFKIEKGKWYVCIKDLLDNYANKAFHKGDTYYSPEDGYLIPSNSNVPFEVFCPTTYFRDWTIQDAKDGDVVYHSDSASNGIFIFKELLKREFGKKVICYCDYDSEDGFCLGEYHTCCWADAKILHPATKEQCDLLFQKMKESGYKWNPETKTLEKLSKFKVGDRIVDIYKKHLHCDSGSGEISQITDDKYIFTDGSYIHIQSQDNWELVVPDKFDINTLVPFESRVLARDSVKGKWHPGIWGYYDSDKDYPYRLIGDIARYCIPYEGNEHLLGKTDDCAEYFKTWK